MNILYHYPLSPFSRKVRLCLAEKKIEVGLVEERYWEQGAEFLRRNPAYVRDYDCVMTGGRRGDIAAREAMARRWGLCFPMSAVPLGARKSCALVGGDLRLHQHPRRGAAGMPGG